MNRTGPSKPVRVAIVDNAMAFGGTLTVVRNLAKHLDPDKVELTVITACKEPFLEGYASSRVSVHVCRPYAHYQRVHKWATGIESRFGRNWFSKYLILAVLLACRVANLPYALRIGLLCVRARAQIVHYNQFAVEPFGITRFLRSRTALHLHLILPGVLPRSFRTGLAQVRAYIAVSDSVLDAAVRVGIPPDLIEVIPNFVEQPPADPTPLPVVPTIGIFGRVIPWKGQREFLEAARIVLQRFPEARALVVGGAADWGDAYLEECITAVRDWGLSDRVEFTGMVRDVSAYYQRCTVVVHASIEPEPFGMVLIEAMAQGRPVVASSLGAGAEIVEDGRSGLVADPRDPQMLADRVCALLADRQLAEKMGREGLREVQMRYDPRVVTRRFESFYQHLSAGA